MNWLIEELPESVWIDGLEYPVNAGFRAMLLIDMVMHDRELLDSEKIDQALDIFYCGNVPADTKAASERMIWFQHCGKKKKKKSEAANRLQRKKRALDYEKDSEYIFADFYAVYGMDLTDRSVILHWWKFSAMLECLPETCRICKIMYYRTADTRGMGKEHKKFMQKMREIYSLEDEISTEDRMTLAQRNRAMQEYVSLRYREADLERR